MHIVKVEDSSLECLLCSTFEQDRIFIVDNTRDGKEKIINHLWEDHKFKGHITGVS